MNVDRLLKTANLPKFDKTACSPVSSGVQFINVVKSLVHKFFSIFGIALMKNSSLKKYYSVESGLKLNAKFARNFIIKRTRVDEVYLMVADDASRLSLDRYLNYRFALPLFCDENKYCSYTLNTDYLLEKYDGHSCEWVPTLCGAGKKITDIAIVQTFVAEQYMFDNVTLVSSGDTVLDCGCFLGETAIYFARLCGNLGKVYSFEPDFGYFKSANENIKRNGFDNIISVVNAAIIAQVGEASYSPCYKGKADGRVPAMTIDDFCLKNCINVDILKMDIEGDEFDALVGARDTILRDKPILMISAYHKPDDIFVLSEFINVLDCGYKIYFRDRADFVLFAIPDTRKDRLQ